MQMISRTDAFRGRWAVHPVGWLRSLLAVTLLVMLQECQTPFPAFGLVLLSALAQHVVAGGLVVAVGLLTRKVFGEIPLWLIFGLWTASGVLRGVIGGWFALSFAGAPPEYALRIAYWVAGTLVIMPLATYLLAQFELRRRLVGELQAVSAQLEAQREAERRGIDERTAELVSAVRDAVAPLIAEVRATLRSAEASDGEISLGAVSARLEGIADEARSVIDQATGRVTPPVPRTPAHLSVLVEALTFSRARPIFLSLLTALATSALFLLDSLRVGGVLELLENLASIAAGSIGLAAGLAAARAARRFTPLHALGVFAFAAAAAQLALIAVDPSMESLRDRILIGVIPVAFGASASVIASAVGLAFGNVKLIASLDDLESESRTLSEQARAQHDEIAGHVSLVLHGPLLGRLSACIMALNFYLAEPAQRRGPRRAATTDGVLAHLDLVAADLEKLSSTRW